MLKIADARAAELAALDEDATSEPWLLAKTRGWGQVTARGGHVADLNSILTSDERIIIAARNALPDLLADRAEMLDLLRRAEKFICTCDDSGDDIGGATRAGMMLQDEIRALLASVKETV